MPSAAVTACPLCMWLLAWALGTEFNAPRWAWSHEVGMVSQSLISGREAETERLAHWRHVTQLRSSNIWIGTGAALFLSLR